MCSVVFIKKWLLLLLLFIQHALTGIYPKFVTSSLISVLILLAQYSSSFFPLDGGVYVFKTDVHVRETGNQEADNLID